MARVRHSGWSNESSTSRGYGYAWQQRRRKVLDRDGHLCRCDECLGGKRRLRPATEVNHIVSKAEAKRRGWTQDQIDDPTNLQAVNAECHKRITLEQKGAKPQPRIGVDGFPIE